MLKNFLIVGLLCASLAFAQGKSKGGGGGMGQGAGAPPPNTKLDNIALALNLNKDQRKAVKTIIDDGAKEATPLREQLSKSRIAVGEAIAAQKSEDELKQVARSSSDLSAQLTEIELKTFGKIYGSLDDTQKKDVRALSRVVALMSDIFREKNWNDE